MASICHFVTVLFLIQRSYASYPSEGIEEESPIAVASQPIPEVEAEDIPAVPAVAKKEYAMPPPIVGQASAVAPAPVIAHAPYAAPQSVVAQAQPIAHAPYAAPQSVVVQAQPVVQAAPVPVPYPVHIHHHNPRTEVRNVVSRYTKESGHTSATAMVSGDHHAFSGLDFHPAGHLPGDEYQVAPWKARKHHQKMALKKAARKHKVTRKHKVARKQKTLKKKN
ncbi:hypothetical protein ANCCAN_07102 [Ancylostoma caninum]|uniref:Uncharacterized protein n=1 Tax=Ancylostoma caninum TaxID=29170 RepID=A0A368GRE1_ANCCA|nr:hypothetical protein ANCCAN_07102 [Ancylostoma caninum]